jgi:phenylacetate-CoA ligase
MIFPNWFLVYRLSLKQMKKLDFFTVMKLTGFPIDEAISVFNAISLEANFLEWQNLQREIIVDYHLRNNDFYKTHLKNWKGAWDDIPIITKNDLQGDHLSKIPNNGIKNPYLLKTSGSSGHPLTIVKDRLCHALAWVNIAENYALAGVNLSDSQARFYGIPLGGMANFKELLKDWLANRVRFPVFNLDDKTLEKWSMRFKHHSFKYLYGYTNSMVAFATYFHKNGMVLKDICPSLVSCIITAEVCSDIDREILEKGFGVPVFNEYGASEISIIGFKSNADWLVSSKLVYVEVVDEDDRPLPDGQRGRLLCTSLFNKGTPLIRYEVGDIASIRHENDKTYITKLSGRTSDMIILPSGRKVPGLTFYYVARQLIEKCHEIREFRVVQTDAQKFVVEVIAADGLKDKDILPKLQYGFDTYLEPGLDVSLKRVEAIIRTGAGKFKHFVSMDTLD